MRILILSLLFLGCQAVPVISTEQPKPPVQTSPPPVIENRIAGSWDNGTRNAWSDAIVTITQKDFAIYTSAKDSSGFCPNFTKLTDQQKLKAILEFWIAIANYESGWKPTSESVDVGSAGDKDSWSVGLFQMSGNDSAAKNFGYKYEKLKEPIPNIEVALFQMKKQILKSGLWFLPVSAPNRYWAVILVGGKYSKIPEIKARVVKNLSLCI